MSTPQHPANANIPHTIVFSARQVNTSSIATSAAADERIVQHSIAITINTRYGAIVNHLPQPTIARHPTLPDSPQPLRSFRGRAAEQAALQQALARGRSAWVYGAAGSGLSSLLRQVSTTPTARSFPDGVLYVTGDVAPFALDDLLQYLFNSFYTSQVAVKVTPQIAQNYLGHLRTLFVFDRLTLPSIELQRLAALLSQHPMLFAADTPNPMPMSHMRLDGIPDEDALALTATAAGLDHTQTHIQVLLSRLCHALNNCPLPILLAARMIAGNETRLPQVVEALEKMMHEREPLTRAVRLLVSQIDQDEQAALAAIVGAGGTDVALDALVEISQRPAPVLVPALTKLEARGMVKSSNQRFAIVSPGVKHALAQVLQPAQERLRSLAYFAAALPTFADNLDRVERELGNILAAATTALAQQEMVALGILAQGLQPLLVLRGYWQQWRHVIDWARQAGQATGNHELYAWALHEYGTYACVLGDPALAADALTKARDVRRRLGDEMGAVISQHNLSLVRLLAPSPPVPVSPQSLVSPGTAPPLSQPQSQLSPWHWFMGALPIVILLLSIMVSALLPNLLPSSAAFVLQPTPTFVAQPVAVLHMTATALAQAAPPDIPSPVVTNAPLPVNTPASQPAVINPTATPVPPTPTVATPSPMPTDTPSPMPTDTPSPTPTPTLESPTATPVSPTPTPSVDDQEQDATDTATTEPTTSPTDEGDEETPVSDDGDAGSDEETPEPDSDSDEEPTESPTPDEEPVATSSATPEESPTPDEEATQTPSATPEDTTAPDAPELIEPINDVTLDCANTVLLRWDPVEDESDIDAYEWELEESVDGEVDGEDDSFSDRDSDTTSDTSVEIDDITCGLWYRWRVRAFDGAGNASDDSFDGVFFIEVQETPTPSVTPSPTPDNSPPPAPDPNLPGEGDIIQCGESVELAWSEVTDPSDIDYYEWQIEYSIGGRDGAYSLDSSGESIGTSVTLSNLDCRNGAWFRWRVRAVDNEGNIGPFFTPHAYFKIDMP